MSRVFAIAACGLTLAACSSLPSMDFMKPAPATEVVRVDSEPAGAEARTLQGQTCRTPCELSLPLSGGDTSITFALTGYQAQTVPVHLLPPSNPAVSDEAMDAHFVPNPVFAELDAATPGRKPPLAPAKKPAPRKPAAPRTASGKSKSAPAPANSAFPPPPAQSSFPPPSQSSFPPPPSSAFPPAPAPAR